MNIIKHFKLKNMTLENKKSLGVHILLTFSIIAVFKNITEVFYQQDEWLGYGLYLANGSEMIFQNTGSFWGAILGQGRILTNLLYFLSYKYFPLEVFPIAILAIIFHIVNTLLVFNLAKRLFKKILPALLGSLFFAVSSVSQSAVTWPAASINTLPSTTLILISIAFYFKFLKKNEKKWLLYGFWAIYASLFFKETGIFLFLLIPLVSLLFKKFSLKSFVSHFWYYFLVVLSIVAFRLFGFLLTPHSEALFLTGSSKYFFDSLVVRSILYPLTSFSLTIIPSDSFLYFARYIVNVYYPFIPEAQFILVAQTIVLDLLATISTAIIGIISLTLLKITNKKLQKNIIFWFIFLLASFLPYAIISKSYSYLESRYYYLAAVAWAMIFAWFFDLLIIKVKSSSVKVGTVLLFVCFVYTHTVVLNTQIETLVNESQIRIEVLNQLAKLKPNLTNNKNIFYVTGDTDYLLPGNKVPFQQGFGYTLLDFYLPKSEYPPAFLNNTELFEIGRQGYYEVNGYGFGYYSDKESLMSAVKSEKFEKKSVYAFSYESKKQVLSDITEEIRALLP